jgi:hypothetical protein
LRAVHEIRSPSAELNPTPVDHESGDRDVLGMNPKIAPSFGTPAAGGFTIAAWRSCRR